MRQFLITLLVGVVCLLGGLGAGIWFGPQIKQTDQVRWMQTAVAKVTGGGAQDGNSPYEMYDYPTIKWKAKPLSDAEGAIAQLWTRYEGEKDGGKINYRLTVFKAPSKSQCEVQLLDDQGFKVMQFNASDFHQIPGAPDIMEARESTPSSESEYRRLRDYSIK